MSPRTKHAQKIIALTAITLMPLGIVGCTSDTPPAASSSSPAGGASSAVPSSTAPESSPSASTETGAAGATFGSGCSAIPEVGKGSFDGMASDPVATAASNNPQLSTLVSAVKAAGLVDTLNNATDVTVFAPNNAAFSKINKATLTKLLTEKSKLSGILTLHVVPGQLTPANLAGSHKTLNGQSITIAGSGEDFTVNDSSKIVCGNVKTANATVYIIDTVLMPS